MAESKSEVQLKEYAGGWITEKKGTEVPGFLRLAAIVVTGGAFLYLLWFMNGEVNHPDRGRLVQQFNSVTHSSSAFMYVVAALIAVYLAIVVRFAFHVGDHED
jgi:hypothetical protein